MNLYYVVIAIIVLLFIFPSIRTSIFDMIIPRSLFTSNNNKGNSVEDYSIENFDGKNKKVVFSSYTADWCPHCVDFKRDILPSLQQEFSGHPYIKIRNVDCTNDKSGNKKTEAGNQIEGYPTLVTNVYVDGKMKEIPFTGSRDPSDIINYLKGL